MGSFINNEPILIAFASKHRMTFIKNTRKMHLGKLADFSLQTDLHKKLICPPTAGNVVNEAGKGSKPPAQRALHPAARCPLPAPALQLQTGADHTIAQQSCLPGDPPPSHLAPQGRGCRSLPRRKPQDMRYWALMQLLGTGESSAEEEAR